MRNLIICLLIFSFFQNNVGAKEKELRFHYLSTENGLPRNTAFSIVEDKYGFIWIATIDGICKFDGYKVKMYPADKNNIKTPINNRPLITLKDNKGNIWFSFSSSNEFCRYNYQTDDFTRVPIKSLPRSFSKSFDRSIHQKRIENQTYIWDVATSFLIQTNKRTHKKITYRYSQKNSYGLKDEMVQSLYLDSNNILWVATDVGGVYYADVNQPNFNHYFYTDNSVPNFSETAVRAICKSTNGDLWIGTRKSGIARLSKTDNRLTYFKHNPHVESSIAENRIRKIYRDKFGQLWFGTKNGIDRLIDNAGRFKHYPAIDKQLVENSIFAIGEDEQDNLWIGTWMEGIARYDRANDRFISYTNKCPDYLKLIRTLLKVGKTSLWIGTEGNGLAYMKRESLDGKERLSFTQYIHQSQNPNSLSDDRIYSLCTDPYGFLWIGTGGGLNRFDPRTGRFLRFPDKRFLANGMIFGILRDNDHLWVSHQLGLTRIDCKTFVTSDYTNHDDLFNNEFSEDAYYRDSQTGECFFGGNLGYISFNPDIVKINPNPPKVVLTDLRISGKSVGVNQPLKGHVLLHQPTYLTKTVTLNWDERNIELEFAALHFANPHNNIYLYRLIGFDKEWRNTNATNRIASYTNLPAGKYLFEVNAANSNSVWAKNPAVMEIIILPPWWNTWWAYLIYLLCASGIVYSGIKILLTRKNLYHQLELERLNTEKAIELEELKSNFFTNVSHELRTPLTLIIDPVKKLMEDENPVPQNLSYFLKLIFDNSKRMLSLVNQLLDLKKIESREMKLNVSYTDIVARIKSLVEIFEFQAKERGILLKFQSEEDCIMTGVDVDKLDKIIINLLSNAFKFTPEKGIITVEIKYSEDKNCFEITVQDSGAGIPPEKIKWIFDPFYQVDNKDQRTGTGIGLSLVKDFVELHHGSIQVDSTIGRGTSFQLFFPIENREEQPINTIDQSNAPSLISEIHSVHHDIKTMEKEDADVDLPIVLIVEDNVEVREYLQMVLINNFRVHTAGNGLEGFNKAIEIIPDLIVSDIMMPVMGGVELCERIKTDPKTSHIPMVLLTARQSEELILASFETGADDYIFKPFNTTTLVARIKNLIESRKKLRLLFDKSTGYNLNVIASNQVDKLFLDTLAKKIYENMNRLTFDVEELAAMMNMSRVQLNRKIKSLTDKTALEFVLTIRLNKAAEYLLSGLYNVTEVSEMVGYSEATNFTRSFTRQFGESPKNYITSHRNGF